MKRVILGMLILVLSMSLFFGVVTVNAEAGEKDQYYQITDGVTFVNPDDASVAGLKLPTGYWVKYIGTSGAGHHVEYNGIKLFVSDDNFANMIKFDVNKYKPLEKPMFSMQPIHVQKNEEDEIYDRPLYATKECTQDKKLAESTTLYSQDLTFIATDHTNGGELVYLVSRPTSDGKQLIGYIKAKFTDMPNIVIPEPTAPTLKPTPEPTPDPDQPTDPEAGEGLPDTGSGEIAGGGVLPEDDDKNAPPTNNIVKVILISAICVLAIVLVFLIFKPTRKNKRGHYDVDDMDDYDRDDAYQDRY